MSPRRRIVLIWNVIYVALTAGLAWGVLSVRDRHLEWAAQPQSRAEWEAWKEAVRDGNESASQPIARRVLTADEPPATILLRDHFPGVCLTLFLVWTAFFAFMAMVTTGVLRGTPPPGRD